MAAVNLTFDNTIVGVGTAGCVLAYFIWTEIPDFQSLMGILIIVASGLYTLHREIFHSRTQN